MIKAEVIVHHQHSSITTLLLSSSLRRVVVASILQIIGVFFADDTMRCPECRQNANGQPPYTHIAHPCVD